MSLIENILKAKEGEVVSISPSWIVINDGPSSKAIDEIKTVKDKERTIVFYDHLVPTGSSEDAEVFKKIRGFAERFDLKFYQAKGIGYLYMMDNMVKSGDVVIEASKHSAIFGSRSVLGLDVSALELARVIESGRYSMVVPKALRVRIEGKLRDGVAAIDLALFALKAIGKRKGYSIELESALDKNENDVIASVLSLSDADCVLFGALDKTADIVIDASSVTALAMLPSESFEKQNEAFIVDASSLDSIKFNAGMIGGYTAGSIEALKEVHSLIKGKKLRLGFRLSISPATSSDYLKAIREGIITDFIDYGAQILPPADHSIVKQGAGAMGVNENLITTNLYTFPGAMGLESAKVYTASHISVISKSWE